LVLKEGNHTSSGYLPKRNVKRKTRARAKETGKRRENSSLDGKNHGTETEKAEDKR